MPAPPASFYRRSESLAQKIQDLANEFANMASVLSQQYDTLNKATNGLLDGTFPWKGMGADTFFATWQEFGTYMQQMQKSCEDTHVTLIKLFGKIDDAETQQCWDILLTIAGGIITIISLAAAIAEGGLNPFVDGFFAWAGSFTEQEGSSVLNVSEEITQADTTAAMELQTIEGELTTSPALTGSNSALGDMDGGVDPTNLDGMTMGIDMSFDFVTIDRWNQWINDYTFDYDPSGNLSRISTDVAPSAACAPSAVKMFLADNGITITDQQIVNDVGYVSGYGTEVEDLVNGLHKMGLSSASDEPYMTLDDLRNTTNGGEPLLLHNMPSKGKPILAFINLSPDASSYPQPHAILVDGFEGSGLGEMVRIRDPFFNPSRAYLMPLRTFLRVWDGGGIAY